MRQDDAKAPSLRPTSPGRAARVRLLPQVTQERIIRLKHFWRRPLCARSGRTRGFNGLREADVSRGAKLEIFAQREHSATWPYMHDRIRAALGKRRNAGLSLRGDQIALKGSRSSRIR